MLAGIAIYRGAHTRCHMMKDSFTSYTRREKEIQNNLLYVGDRDGYNSGK